jgi:hypothetical protein
VLPRTDQQPRLVAGALEDRALKALRKLGRRHVPVALRRLEKAIAAHADEYRERKDALEHDAARARHLAAGFAADELDARGWPTAQAHEARARRARPAPLEGTDAAAGDGDGGAADDAEARGRNPSGDGAGAEPAPEGSRIAA